MAIPKRRPDPVQSDLTSLSDFLLLATFTEFLSPQSDHLKAVAWEIIRRYSSHLEASAKPEPKDYSATLGEARWGDAKRVERIFGIKRGVLLKHAQNGQVITSSLGCGEPGEQSQTAQKAKRLYCLMSVAKCVESGISAPNS